MNFVLKCPYPNCICKDKVEELIDHFQALLFPGYFFAEIDSQKLFEMVTDNLKALIAAINSSSSLKIDSSKLITAFFDRYDKIVSMLKMDLQAIFDNDPSLDDIDEAIFTSPGLVAIMVYRIAHELDDLGLPYIPRMMSEIIHSQTGIDIHPRAQIGESFFIDHGTGIVIGETTIIGNHVKLYQGTTLGALSLSRGQQLKGIKRHPTIGNNVTIYANASILGGKTTIGNNVIIGANTYILESVPDNSVVVIKNFAQEIIKRKQS